MVICFYLLCVDAYALSADKTSHPHSPSVLKEWKERQPPINKKAMLTGLIVKEHLRKVKIGLNQQIIFKKNKSLSKGSQIIKSLTSGDF